MNALMIPCGRIVCALFDMIGDDTLFYTFALILWGIAFIIPVCLVYKYLFIH